VRMRASFAFTIRAHQPQLHMATRGRKKTDPLLENLPEWERVPYDPLPFGNPHRLPMPAPVPLLFHFSVSCCKNLEIPARRSCFARSVINI